jgi:predicted Zn finger-like uncharacterized protein
MAPTRITCPDCKSVLKPTKPVPDGKKVKCPKCGNFFTTPGLVEDEDERPRKKAAGKKAKAAIKKMRDPEPPPRKASHDEDYEESGGGTYSFVQEEEKREEEKPQIEYAPDMSIKDLRGPAQELLVRPSNYMILIGGLSALCDIFLICVAFWPMVFSDSPVDYVTVLEKHYKDKQDKNAIERLKSIKERKDLKDEDLAIVEEAEDAARVIRFIVMGVYIFLLIYNAIAIVGAVKMQNMESRGWGIASSIMTILPFGSSGLSGAVALVLYFLFKMLLDDESMGQMYAGIVSGLAWVIAIFVGVWSLRTLMSQTVIDGFEYVAD